MLRADRGRLCVPGGRSFFEIQENGAEDGCLRGWARLTSPQSGIEAANGRGLLRSISLRAAHAGRGLLAPREVVSFAKRLGLFGIPCCGLLG